MHKGYYYYYYYYYYTCLRLLKRRHTFIVRCVLIYLLVRIMFICNKTQNQRNKHMHIQLILSRGRQPKSLTLTPAQTGRIPALRRVVTFPLPATEHHRPLAVGTKLYCSVAEASRCEATVLEPVLRVTGHRVNNFCQVGSGHGSV